MILSLADRFHCTPEVAAAMDARVLRMIDVVRLGKPPRPDEEM